MDEELQDENKISKGRKVQLHVFEVNKWLQAGGCSSHVGPAAERAPFKFKGL